MSMFFMKLLNMSIAAGWLILAVIVLRLLLRKMPRSLCCILWGMVAVRLICPFSPESPFSLIPDAEPVSLPTLQTALEPIADSRQNPRENDGTVVMTEMPEEQVNGGAAVMAEMPEEQVNSGSVVITGMSEQQGNGGTSVSVGMPDAQEDNVKTAMGDVLDTEINSGISAAGNTPGIKGSSESLTTGVIPDSVVNSGISAADSERNPMAVDEGSGISGIWNRAVGKSVAAASGNNVSSPYVWMNAGSMIWITGLTVMLGYACFSFLKLQRKVREAVRLRDNIWLCDRVKSPFILGVIRPKIYLSSESGVSSGMDEETIKYILAHEEAHLKRRDHWWKILGYLLLAVYWFHPLVWAAYTLFCRDIEIACDEKVIKDMDMEGKKLYSNALVTCSVQRKMVAACPLAFGEIGVKERVRTILNHRKPAFWAVVVAICACAAVALCFLTNPRRDTFDVKIVIPANSGQAFYYSDEEISPYRDRVILQSGEGLGDTEVVLKPVEGVTKEDAYADLTSYMTPGLSVKMYAQKGGWFRVGVMMENATDKDIVVYVRVKGVTVRIADYVSDENGASGPNADSETAGGNSGLNTDSETAGGVLGSNTDGENAGGISGLNTDRENVGGSSGLNANGESAVPDSTITFTGMIRPHALNSSKPIIMVEPVEGELSYDSVCFVLPDDEAEWASRVNSLAVITCRDVFEESDPPFGELISIGGVSTMPIMKEPVTGVNALPHLQGSELEAVTAAIMEANAQSWPEEYDFECCDFVLLETLYGCPLPGSTTHTITYYGWTLDEKYNISDKGIEELGGSHIPVALTFTLDENGYELQEYWKPRDGSYFVTDIRDKFPAHIAEDGINSQRFIFDQKQSCYKQAIMAYGLDTDAVIDSLLDTICSEPGTSSNPRDYIDAHSIEYRELLYYGEYTLRYCFARFEQGGETGLEGSVMALVCEELLQTKGAIPEDAGTAATGQLWYETIYAHAGNRVEPYLE